MIKRIRFTTHVPGSDSAAGWRAAASAARQAPPDIRPLRAAHGTVLPDLIPDPPHDAVELEWFDDPSHLARFDAWLSSPDGASAAELRRAADADAAVVLAEEHVVRGADWLERRWRDGGTRLKQMAIARRADGLTPEEFSELWRSRAGKVGAVRIPDEARGAAYVQNHPLPKPGDGWPYDAVNEVYFDDVDSLKTRIAWFAENFDATTENDLVRESCFIALREEALSPTFPSTSRTDR